MCVCYISNINTKTLISRLLSTTKSYIKNEIKYFYKVKSTPFVRISFQKNKLLNKIASDSLFFQSDQALPLL